MKFKTSIKKIDFCSLREFYLKTRFIIVAFHWFIYFHVLTFLVTIRSWHISICVMEFPTWNVFFDLRLVCSLWFCDSSWVTPRDWYLGDSIVGHEQLWALPLITGLKKFLDPFASEIVLGMWISFGRNMWY